MPPLTMMVKPVSGLCNMRCAYCFYADEMARRRVDVYARMTDETLENLVRRAFAYADGSVTLAFQGGEPTLAGAEYYQKLLALERKYNARRLPVHHAIQTNGYDLSDELISVLAKGQFLVGVSLDGCREVHDKRRVDAGGRGTYDRAMASIGRLKAAGIDYNILCVVDETLGQAPDRVFDALKEHRFLQFIPCLDPMDGAKTESSLTPETYGRFLITMFGHYERALKSGRYVSMRTFDNFAAILAGHPPEECGFLGRCTPHFLVESSGDVYPCDFYALDEWRLGNLNETSLLRIARAPKINEFCALTHAIDKACGDCPWRGLCRYACRRDMEPLAPGGGNKSRWCEAYRMFFQKCAPALRALAQKYIVGR